jgi:hypothetical protein
VKNLLKYNFIMLLLFNLVLVTSDAELYFGFAVNNAHSQMSFSEPCGDIEHPHSNHLLLLDLYSEAAAAYNISATFSSKILPQNIASYSNNYLKSIWQPPEIS